MRTFFISIVATGVYAAATVSAVATGHQIFVIDDSASEEQFDSGVAGLKFLGSEEFANSTLGATSAADLGTHTLAPGTSVSNFPGGTDATLGVTFQTNSLGGAPLTPNAGGTLYASGSDVGGTGMIRVGPEDMSHSLDVFIDPPGYRGLVRGVSFVAFQEGGDDAVIRIYNSDNVELGSISVSDLDIQEPKRIGVLAPEGETIFRINFWVPSGYGDASNVQVHAIPEPATTGALLAAAALVLAALKRRKHIRDRAP